MAGTVPVAEPESATHWLPLPLLDIKQVSAYCEAQENWNVPPGWMVCELGVTVTLRRGVLPKLPNETMAPVLLLPPSPVVTTILPCAVPTLPPDEPAAPQAPTSLPTASALKDGGTPLEACLARAIAAALELRPGPRLPNKAGPEGIAPSLLVPLLSPVNW